MRNSEYSEEAASLLAEHQTLVLATSEGGAPWASQVFYAEEVVDGRLSIYFATLKPSRKWRHLKKNPIVSFAVGSEMPTRWLQGAGVAEPVEAPREKERIVKMISSKTPVYDLFISSVPADVFRIAVDEMRLVDMTKGFPKTFWKRSRPIGPKGVAGFVAATRAQVMPVMAVPVIIGATFAWYRGNEFSLLWFAVTVVGAVALHLAANVINDVFDMRSGADRVADAVEDSLRTGSPFATPAHAAGLLLVSAACGLLLAIARGPAVLWIGTLGLALAYFYVAPPVRFGYRGRGLGEAGILVAFGLLPTAGSYYVQALDIPAEVWAVGLFPGILSTLVLYHHHFLHHRADRIAGKMSPVAVLGPERAIRVSRPALAAAALLLVALGAGEILPWASIISSAALVPAWVSVGRAARTHAVPAYLKLLRTSAASSIAAGLLLALSLLVSPALGI